MNNQHCLKSLYSIKQAITQKHTATRNGKTRIALQIGHCSNSVEAQEVTDTISKLLPTDTYMIITGCDGACFSAPQIVATYPSGQQQRFTNVTPESAQSILNDLTEPSVDQHNFFSSQYRLTMDMCGYLDSTDIEDYIVHDGYLGMAQALSMSPEAIIEEVKSSGLRGRGGAYFPAALKWQGASNIDKTPRYLVVNCEEGEPGVFKDRHLMEGVPHRILEGAIIAARASGINEVYIYINAEANLSTLRIETAVDQAYKLGLLGNDILGSGFNLDVYIYRGAGGYVCGEETTLLNTMGGYRREPRLKPPFPTESGLWNNPTVINNAETLATIPFIISKGSQTFTKIGTDSDKGTKIISLSGSVQRPGVIEVPMGTTLREIVYDIGGGIQNSHTLAALAVGGPSSGLLPISMLDTPIRPGKLHDAGVMLGAGGIIAINNQLSILESVRTLAAYNASESCGKCTPCREGTPRMVEVIDRLISKEGETKDLDELRYITEITEAASLCGLGQASGGPIKSFLHFFKNELAI